MKKKEKLKNVVNLNLTSVINGGTNPRPIPINLLSTGTVNLGDGSSPSSQNYTYCAGDYCVTCVSSWSSSYNCYMTRCDHYYKGVWTGGEGHPT